MKPTADSQALLWTKADGEDLSYPQADSRNLPPRVDFTDPAYLDLVDMESAGGLGKGDAYSIEVMEAAIDRAVANQGARGMYCNSLMLNKALYGRLPSNCKLPNPPAPLEDIIDSAVKTGADLSQVVAWNYANSRAILENGAPIPPILHQRLSIDWADRDNRPPLPRTSGMAGRDTHWLDQLEAGVKAHIEEMGRRRDELTGQARPPRMLFDHALADPEAVRLGAGLNQAYAAALRTSKKEGYTSVLERAKYAAEDYLAHFPPERRRVILRGALANVYGAEAPVADTAVWLAEATGEKGSMQPGIGQSSVASLTIEALRDIGLLDDIVPTREGLVVYPVKMDAEY